MKLVVDGREFDASAQPFIGDLRKLVKEFGFGWGTVAQRLQSVDADTDFTAFLDDPDLLEALMAWIWMARLRSGDRDCTRADVEMTPVDRIEFKADEDDKPAAVEVPQDIPTSAPTGTAAGEGHGRGQVGAVETKPTKRSTKTSKKPSTAA